LIAGAKAAYTICRARFQPSLGQTSIDADPAMTSPYLETRLFPKGQGAAAYEITGLAARCDLVILSDEAAPQVHAVARKSGPPQTVFVSLRNPEPAIAYLHDTVLAGLERPVVVISGSSDRTFPVQRDYRWSDYGPETHQKIRALLAHPMIRRWYAENLSERGHDKLSPIPLGLVFRTAGDRDRFEASPAPFDTRLVRALSAQRVRQGPQWWLRQRVSDLAAGPWAEFCTHLDEEVPERDFIDHLRRHAFVLCVDGGGIDPSPKAWMSMLNGAVPIIRSTPLDEAYRLLPCIIINDWDEPALTQAFIQEQFEHWRARLDSPEMRQEIDRRLSLDYWWAAIRAGRPIRDLAPLKGAGAPGASGLEEPNRRVEAVRGRPFRVGLGKSELEGVQSGAVSGRYRGVLLQKNPFDRVLYLELLQKLKPRTIIEVGSFKGGSALWFRDQCAALGLDAAVISIDLKKPNVRSDGVTFFEGDSLRPEETFPHTVIQEAPRPWLIVSDSAHTYDTESRVLDYFSDRMAAGDYIVVEDGVVADFTVAKFARFEDGPNRAVHDFLTARPDFEIDTELCDFFGYNVTYCPNAWLYKAR
jgi:cephalosporin hydroxylase